MVIYLSVFADPTTLNMDRTITDTHMGHEDGKQGYGGSSTGGGSCSNNNASVEYTQEQIADHNFGDDCLRASLAFLFAFFGMISNLVILAVVHERVPRDIKKPLPDLGFDLTPEYGWTLDVAEYIILVVSFLVVVLIFVHRYRYVLFS